MNGKVEVDCCALRVSGSSSEPPLSSLLLRRMVVLKDDCLGKGKDCLFKILSNSEKG